MDRFEFKTIREAMGLTQAELGDALGVSRVFIGLMERGHKSVSKRTAEAMRSLRPKPLDISTTETDTFYRSIEVALITAGIAFTVKYATENDIAEYELDRPSINLIVSRYDHEGVRKKIQIEKSGLFVVGASAAKFVTDLITLGGGRASRSPL